MSIANTMRHSEKNELSHSLSLLFSLLVQPELSEREVQLYMIKACAGVRVLRKY